jgi:alpha-N-acetylglucosamine transferase
VLYIWDEMNIVGSFQQLATLKYRKMIFFPWTSS